MINKIISVEDYKNGSKLPKRGSCIDASNDGLEWQTLHFVQLDTHKTDPFVCVNLKKDIHFPASKGSNFSYIRYKLYDVHDLVLFGDTLEKKFITRDRLYETKIDKNSRNNYWQRTLYATGIGTEHLWSSALRDLVIVDINNAEKAVEVLNNLVT